MNKDICIWFDCDREHEIFARARRAFELETTPDSATVDITCSGIYELYVNGRYVGRGPATSGTVRKKYDTRDVASYLKAGKNLVAVKLVHHGYSTGDCPESKPGFACTIRFDGKSLDSDSNWRMSEDPAFSMDTSRRNGCYGRVEIFSEIDNDNWLQVDYEDSGWQAAGVIPTIWEELVPREIPFRREESLMPLSVIKTAEVLNQEYGSRVCGTKHELQEFLLLDVPVEPEYTTVANAENALIDDDSFALITQPSPLDQSNYNQYCATVILDFGRELTGYGWIDVEGNEAATVDVVYAERMTAGRVPAIVQGTGYADRYILGKGRKRHQVYDWKGYRYVQLTFRNLTEPLKLYAVGTTFVSYPVENEGSFTCNDEMLAKIWEVGAYTQQLCTQTRLMDCPWREQQEWLGDGRVQLLILLNAFNAKPMARNFIRNFAESQKEDGMISSVSYRSGYIVDYSLWWIQGVLDVLLADQDLEFAREMFPHAMRLFEWFEPFRDEDGLLKDVPGWTFIDWANVAKDGKCAPLNATYFVALKAARTLAMSLGLDSDAQSLSGKMEQLASAYHETFWSDEKDYYVDNTVDGKQNPSFSQHTQSITVYAGLNRVDAHELMARAVSDESLVKTEPYFSFYLCEALGMVGLADKATDFILNRWGHMLERGATSFWEEWQVEGTFRNGQWLARPRSHCHAWSAAPTAYLSRFVLGVRVEDINGPIVIAPNLCGLTSLSGTVPTAYGPVRLDIERKGDDLNISLTIPESAEYELTEPEVPGKVNVKIARR